MGHHVLVAINADNVQSKGLLATVAVYQLAQTTSFSIVYVMPEVTPALIASPLQAVDGAEVEFTQSELTHAEQQASELLFEFANKLEVPEDRRYLRVGSFGFEVRRIARHLGVDEVVGYDPSLWEKFSSSCLYKMIHSFKTLMSRY